jgi:hypothetical protein
MSQPVACNFGALNPAERIEYRHLVKSVVVGSAATRRSFANGYEFTYESGLFAKVSRWIELEHRCCPFLDFELSVGEEEVRVRVKGPIEAKQILDAAFA